MTTIHSSIPSGDGTTAALPAALRRFLGESLERCAPIQALSFPLLRVPAGTPLVLEGAPARQVYLVQSGCLKSVRNGEDGYEQVLDFVVHDEFVGCDGLAGGRHASGAVALQESWVIPLPVGTIRDLSRQLTAFADRWQAELAGQLGRAHERAWVASAVGSEKRLARFLVLSLRRQVAAGGPSDRLELCMDRRDLGSHLGLAHESVSRSFTLLASAGLLQVHNRTVDIVDLDALRAFASSTRGYPNVRGSLQRSTRAPARTSVPSASQSTAVLPSLERLWPGLGAPWAVPDAA
jgi:CRP/FNR family transcriptional regulator